MLPNPERLHPFRQAKDPGAIVNTLQPAAHRSFMVARRAAFFSFQLGCLVAVANRPAIACKNLVLLDSLIVQ